MEDASKTSSLRHFRLEKPRKEAVVVDLDSPCKEQNEHIGRPAAKRARVLEESEESESESQNGNSAFPEPEVMEECITQLCSQFPFIDVLELQDTLTTHKWDVAAAAAELAARRVATATAKSAQQSTSAKKTQSAKKPAKKKLKRGDDDHFASDDESGGEYDNNDVVYDSDDDEEGKSGKGGKVSEAQRKVLQFFNEANENELAALPRCSKKKVESINELRPFDSWRDIVQKFQDARGLNPEILNGASAALRMRDAIAKLMERCEKITDKLEGYVEELKRGEKSRMDLKEQPGNLNKSMTLAGYQMIGLNWIVLMHRQNLNGILADEMGLGKTIQAISFLAHLKELGDEGPHLIVVPSSTFENWQNELALWCPSLKILPYYGSQDERRFVRQQIIKEELEFDVILTTYNMVISSAEDRKLFKKVDYHYVIFDEAHMLKNMSTSRYDHLMRVNASRKLLLTGTPLQNSLIELMSLLVFVMPDMFANKKEQLKQMFSMFPKQQGEEKRSLYEEERIVHAKRIMKPFFLRRLKSQVLTEMPKKHEETLKVALTDAQRDLYSNLVKQYKERAKEISEGAPHESSESGIGFLMALRKVANHPLLVRSLYDDGQVRQIARILKKSDPEHKDANEAYIVEDLSHMSDFTIHKTCLHYNCINDLALPNSTICQSGKFEQMDKLLPSLRTNGDRVLIFSQFTMMLDILEPFLKHRGYKYRRLDGSTPVTERQSLINEFNSDDSIFLFILSTRAGGLGINLTAANTVILHDLDFNPHNDKQAEDRCHRVGQTRPVRVIRLIGEDTIEEGIYSISQEKLQLEQELSSDTSKTKEETKTSKKDVSRLIKTALDVELNDNDVGDLVALDD